MLHLTQHLLRLQLCHTGHIKNKFFQFQIQFSCQQLRYTDVHKEQEEMPPLAPTPLLYRALASNSWAGWGCMCHVPFLLLTPSSLHYYSLWKQGGRNVQRSSEKNSLLLLLHVSQLQTSVYARCERWGFWTCTHGTSVPSAPICWGGGAHLQDDSWVS